MKMVKILKNIYTKDVINGYVYVEKYYKFLNYLCHII